MLILDGKPLAYDRPFTHDGIQYPANWLRLSSLEEKAAIGIEERPNPPSWDQRFYWGYDENGQLISKRLNDEPAFDEDGNVLLDGDGEQIKQTGLKTQWIATQKQIAASLLAPTDWYITRRSETGAEIPGEVLVYRDQVRVISGEREAQIAACVTTEELKELLFGSAETVSFEEDPDTGEMIERRQANPNVATAWPDPAPAPASKEPVVITEPTVEDSEPVEEETITFSAGTTSTGIDLGTSSGGFVSGGDVFGSYGEDTITLD